MTDAYECEYCQDSKVYEIDHYPESRSVSVYDPCPYCDPEKDDDPAYMKLEAENRELWALLKIANLTINDLKTDVQVRNDELEDIETLCGCPDEGDALGAVRQRLAGLIYEKTELYRLLHRAVVLMEDDKKSRPVCRFSIGLLEQLLLKEARVFIDNMNEGGVI